ncbi:CopG/Arc/MetJ family transcriptional regulator [Raoultella ornithinolytica]|nr:CopG/Arc/MetJ family transcriptional regulator [Raoultella ornithinolytica]
MARTMTVDVGDELREFIDSRLRPVITVPRARSCVTRCVYCARSRLNHAFRNSAICWPKESAAAEAKPWNKDAFLKNVRARVGK